jgi:hypothetical protein
MPNQPEGWQVTISDFAKILMVGAYMEMMITCKILGGYLNYF